MKLLYSSNDSRSFIKLFLIACWRKQLVGHGGGNQPPARGGEHRVANNGGWAITIQYRGEVTILIYITRV
jgi:hypothetical protein